MTRGTSGAAVRRQLFGVRREGGRGAMDELAPDLSALLDETLWDKVWARDGIDLRTKSVCTFSALLALERFPYAKAHLYGLRNQGLSREEAAGVVVQLLFYVGLPVVHEGLRLVREVYSNPNPGNWSPSSLLDPASEE